MFNLEKENRQVQTEIMMFMKLQNRINKRNLSIEQAAQEWISRYHDLWFSKNRVYFMEHH